MAEFDPVAALTGGALIGLAAALLMLFAGRLAGISSAFAGLIAIDGIERGWRLAFLAGLIAAPLIAGLVGYPLALPKLPGGLAVMAVGGVLVGVGTKMSGGCTSGHGVCGIARLSGRSIAATVIFMVTAFIVVAVMRHVVGG